MKNKIDFIKVIETNPEYIIRCVDNANISTLNDWIISRESKDIISDEYLYKVYNEKIKIIGDERKKSDIEHRKLIKIGNKEFFNKLKFFYDLGFTKGAVVECESIIIFPTKKSKTTQQIKVKLTGKVIRLGGTPLFHFEYDNGKTNISSFAFTKNIKVLNKNEIKQKPFTEIKKVNVEKVRFEI